MSQLASAFLICLFTGMPLPNPFVPIAAGCQPSPGAADRLSDADLEELLAPIALYPDPLLANVLAASCYPNELAEAAKVAGNEGAIDAASWEPSVKAIAKIPDALKMLTQYPEWTAALGEAFILQSPDVMAAAQRLRARAYANGALATTEQQVVQAQGDTIIISPAQPEVIYVPTYQPSVVYVDNDDDEILAGVIGFGIGITAGLIIGNNMDCDWYGGGCCFGCGWGHHWGGHGDVDVDIDINNNFNNVNINNIKNNGNSWKANDTKLNASLRDGKPQNLGSFKGVGSTGGTSARIPNRATNAKPIAQRPPASPSTVKARPANANRQGTTGGTATVPNRPAARPVNRPAEMNRPAAPKAKPSIPPANRAAERPQPANRPAPKAAPSRPAAGQGAFGGGSQKAASRGNSSRGGGGGKRSR